jgi:multidrug efflux pump subunit AcrA (membrane-fusion protein)
MAIALAIVVGGWRYLAVGSRRTETKSGIPTAEVTRGSLVVTLPVSGALESAVETPVRTEIEGSLIEICEDNSPVKPGDLVYRLDTKDLENQRDELETGLTDAQDALNVTETDGETRVTQAESDAKAAKESLKLAQEKAQAEREKIAAQVKYAEGETARAERELVRAQRLAKMNYIAGTKLRDAEKTYRAQEFVLAQQYVQRADVDKRTGEQVEDQQSALDLALHGLATAKANAQEDIEDGGIHVAEAQRRLDDVDKKIAQCTVASPAVGLAVIETNTENWPERRPYRLGDQVGSGAAPVRVYDFTRMQVRCQIGEMDISRVHRGQDTFVLSSAGNGRRYRGKVAVVEELAQESNVWQGGTPGKKVFGLLITLSEADPARLRPGMTVDLEIVLDSVREATMVPIRAAFKDSGRSVVYRARGEGFERVPVTVGTRNDLQVEVSGGLRVGDRVALERPPAQPAKRGEAKS